MRFLIRCFILLIFITENSSSHEIKADKVILKRSERKAILSGNISGIWDDFIINTEDAIINEKNQKIMFPSKIHIRHKNQNINLEADQGYFENNTFFLYGNVRGIYEDKKIYTKLFSICLD